MITNNFHGSVSKIVNNLGARVISASMKVSIEQKDELEELARGEGKTMSKYLVDALNFYKEFGPSLENEYDAFEDPRVKMLRNKQLFIEMAGRLR